MVSDLWIWHRWQKTLEIGGGGGGYMTTTYQLYLGACPTRKSKIASEATCHNSDEIIFTALVHSVLDSEEH